MDGVQLPQGYRGKQQQKKGKFLKKKLYCPFLWMGFNCLKATANSRRQFTFYHSFYENGLKLWEYNVHIKKYQILFS